MRVLKTVWELFPGAQEAPTVAVQQTQEHMKIKNSPAVLPSLAKQHCALGPAELFGVSTLHYTPTVRVLYRRLHLITS